MKRLFATAIVLVLACSAASAKPRHCMLRVHAEANPQDTDVFSTSVKAQLSGKTVAIEKAARITESDVVGFSAYQVSPTNFGALLQLDEHGRLTLDALSVERRGGYVFVFINGRAITELQIDKRVSDGKLYIASGLTAADIASMRKDWRLLKPRKA